MSGLMWFAAGFVAFPAALVVGSIVFVWLAGDPLPDKRRRWGDSTSGTDL